ncbi:unnamed protein product [Dicrocoelium dendriticum]|nr:unnamed protein product [Dicrocoelium dendriticum]
MSIQIGRAILKRQTEILHLHLSLYSKNASNSENSQGNPNASGIQMVDISPKQLRFLRQSAEERDHKLVRYARAVGQVKLSDDIIMELTNRDRNRECENTTDLTWMTPKGNIFQMAQIAGIQATKQTSNLIPLCHQVPLSHASVSLWFENPFVWIQATAKTVGQSTGVEMEALTGVTVAALTVYDMLKSLKKGHIEITGIRLMEKYGGSRDERIVQTTTNNK